MKDDHPPLDRLLLAREDELPPQEQVTITAHLDQCDTCQANLADLEKSVEVARRRNLRADRDLIEFRAQLMSVDDRATPRQPAWWVHWAVAAAVVAAVVVALPIFRPSPNEVLVAAELLDTLAHRETVNPALPSVRLEPADARDLGALSDAQGGLAPCAASRGHTMGAGARPTLRLPAAVDRLLDAHCFDIDRPLSIAGYRQWYGALRQKSALITRSAKTTSITTETAEGTIRRATLVLNERAAIPELLTLTLQDGQILHLRAASDPVLPDRDALGPRAERPLNTPPVPTAPATAARSAVATFETRVHLLWILHEHGLDLGAAEARPLADGRVELTLSDRSPTTTAVQAEINRLPGITIRRPTGSRPAGVLPEPNEVLSGAVGLADADVEQHVQQPAARQLFRDEVFAGTQALTRHVSALEMATTLVPDETEIASLPASTRGRWTDLRATHAHSARDAITQLRTRLASGGVILPGASASPGSCDGAVPYNKLARQAQTLVAALVGGLATPADQGMASSLSRDVVLSELQAALDRLDACLPPATHSMPSSGNK